MDKLLKNMSLRTKLMLMYVPLMIALVVAVVAAAVGVKTIESQVTSVYYDMLYQVNSALINADRDFYQSMSAATEYHEIMGEFSELDESKLDEKYADYEENRLQVQDNVALAAEIAAKNEELFNVLTSEGGKTFSECVEQFNRDYKVWYASYDVKGDKGGWLKFNEYFVSARTALNDMQEITEAWALEEHDLLEKENRSMTVLMGVVFGTLIVVLGVFVVVVISGIQKGIKKVTEELDELAAGNLTRTFRAESEMGRDEIGRIEKSTKRLTERLRDVMSRTKTMSEELTASGTELAESASQASQASDQVTDAITEISKGAVAQAESVESAVSDTDDIGNNIETITEEVRQMDVVSEEMKQACDKTMGALERLIRQSGEVTVSVKEIGNTINSTNESAKTISEFTQAITDIATQTNLLSLNASIEAARAGDAGRGFAVVADEIRALADQSSSSADKIKSIVERLLADAASSVSVLEKLNESFNVQADQLDNTKSNMESMNANVESVKETSAHITERIESLNHAKNGLTEVISDLSAISEENAASTEETNASMEELNATFTIISDSAGKLQNLANELTDTISYFKV